MPGAAGRDDLPVFPQPRSPSSWDERIWFSHHYGCPRNCSRYLPFYSRRQRWKPNVPGFLTAHDNKDLDAEEKLVVWDEVTENSRNHFIGELTSGLDVKITAKVEDLPAVPAGFSALYNIPPEKFLTVVYAYDDSRGVITVKFPIAKKDGRYYFAIPQQ